MDIAGVVGSVIVGVCAFAFAAIIAGLILHKLIGMYLLNELSPMMSVIVIGIYVWLIICLVTLKIALAIGLLVPLIAILALPGVANRRSDRLLDEEKMEQFRAAIESDPGNLAARNKLANTLYKVGNLDEAIERRHTFQPRAARRHRANDHDLIDLRCAFRVA